MAAAKVSSRLVYVPWYPDEYLSDPKVGMMSRTEEYAYLRLLNHLWLSGRSGNGIGLPDDDEHLAYCCRMTAEEFACLRPALVDSARAVLYRKTQDGKGMLTNRRMEREYEIALARVEVKRINASKGGRPRKEELEIQEQIQVAQEVEADPEAVDADDPLVTTYDDAGNPVITPNLLAEGYNEICANGTGLSKVNIPVSSDRARHAKARLAEHSDKDWWADVFSKITESSFLLGKNDRGWKVTFDFLIRPGSAERISEGNYDNKRAPEQMPVPHMYRAR